MNSPYTQDYRKVQLKYDWRTLDKNFRYLIYFIRRRLRKDWDLVIAVTGEEGSGKSSFSCLLGSTVDRKFNLVDNMAFLPDEKEIVKNYTLLKKYQCYVIDEAIRAFYKMSFMTTMTQTLVRMWATERYQNKCTVLVIPRFTDLVENFRNHRVKLWIHVVSRGRALVYIRDDDPHNQDPWNIKAAQAYKQGVNKRKNTSLLTLDEKIAIEKKMKNFLFEFSFPDLDPEFKRVYQKLKVESRKELEKLASIENNPEESNMMNKIRNQRDEMIFDMIIEKKMSQKEIEVQYNLTKQQIKHILDKQGKIREEKELQRKKIDDITGVHTLIDMALKMEEDRTRSGGENGN